MLDLEKLVFEPGSAGGTKVTWPVPNGVRSAEIHPAIAIILQELVDRIRNLETVKEKV